MWRDGLPLYTLKWLRHGHVLQRVYCLRYRLLYRLRLQLLLGLLVVNGSEKRSDLTFAIFMESFEGNLSVIFVALLTCNNSIK